MNPVTQTFLSAGSRDILVPRFLLNCTDWRLESRLNPQTGMSALHTVQGRKARKKSGEISPLPPVQSPSVFRVYSFACREFTGANPDKQSSGLVTALL
jgi:hypothetical protein